MKLRLVKLAIRREQLLAQVAAQRAALPQCLSPVKTACSIGDKGVTAYRFLQHHPVLLAGGAGLVVALHPRKAFGWARRGWFAWRMVQKLRQNLGTPEGH